MTWLFAGRRPEGVLGGGLGGLEEHLRVAVAVQLAASGLLHSGSGFWTWEVASNSLDNPTGEISEI